MFPNIRSSQYGISASSHDNSSLSLQGKKDVDDDQSVVTGTGKILSAPLFDLQAQD
jgi:hypothetical protein